MSAVLVSEPVIKLNYLQVAVYIPSSSRVELDAVSARIWDAVQRDTAIGFLVLLVSIRVPWRTRVWSYYVVDLSEPVVKLDCSLYSVYTPSSFRAELGTVSARIWDAIERERASEKTVWETATWCYMSFVSHSDVQFHVDEIEIAAKSQQSVRRVVVSHCNSSHLTYQSVSITHWYTIRHWYIWKWLKEHVRLYVYCLKSKTRGASYLSESVVT